VGRSSSGVDTGPSGVVPRRLPALDGIRGLAVLSIMMFHSGATWFAGGGIGVDVFFVLSGFLITGLLLDERRGTGRIRLRSFYARRVLRLLPALLLVVGFLFVWSFVGGLGSQQVHELRRGLVFTLGYAANVQVAFLGELPPFSLVAHMWSLAIEEQFYLVWPLVLALLLRLRFRTGQVLVVAVVAALASTVWRAFLWHGPGDVLRVYYGPDTRADGLLLGCALALVASRRPLPRAPWLALVGGVFLIAQVRLDTHLGSFGYEGGYLLTALAACALIVGAVGAPDGPAARVLGWRPLAAVGAISYGLYLWHWPVYLILNAGRLDLPWLQLQAVRFAVTFAVATASYLLLERPVLSLRSRFRPRTEGDAPGAPTGADPTTPAPPLPSPAHRAPVS
jgi:peptidoglycan/LPS O-acetylase OafA/YrhL